MITTLLDTLYQFLPSLEIISSPFRGLGDLLPSLTGGVWGWVFSLDFITAALGLAYILLEYRASIWMWAVGAVMQLLGIVLYYQKGLYADCGMEFYYLAMTAYGCWKWMGHGAESATQQSESSANGIAITHIPWSLAIRWLCITGGLWLLIWWLLATFTDSTVPVADAFTTALSLAGIWALAHKYLEQWFIWIAVDVVTCWLYFQKEIPFKAILYGIYVFIAVIGYIRWRKLMQAAQNHS